MKTCEFIPFPDAFNESQVLEGTKISTSKIDLYARPEDKLGTHFLEFEISQKQLILGLMKRTIYLDFYRKRLSIRGGFEGIIFEIRGSMIKSYQVDENDHYLVRITFDNGASPQEFWMATSEEIQKLFEALADFRESCRHRNQSK